MSAVQIDLIDWLAATAAPARVYLRRIDQARNMRRFYVLGIERDLFGGACLVVEYGRIGRPGRMLSRAFPSETDATAQLDRQRRQKIRRGYQ